jgi:endonuclease/exonuclease/phosphatase family metal-dependent hydrolase
MTMRRPQDTILDPGSTNSQAINHQTIPVEEALTEKLRELRTLKLFSWNIWFGGREISDAAAKQTAVLKAESADIVFLQECFGDAGLRLGRRTGMTVAQQDYDCAVLSASPIRLLPTDTASYATAALVQTRNGDVLAWSVHLAASDYGPYRSDELPQNTSEVFAQQGERKRTAEAEQILAETRRLQAQLGDIPVIVAGDFNVPSGLDWTGEHRPLLQWPATQKFLDAGYTDAFRAAHPDPVQAPGLSWSQIETLENEPRDRIDFIFVLGMDVASADHLGGAADDEDAPGDSGFTEYGGTARHIPDQRENAFPSDHLAVRATLRNPQ